MCKKVFSGRMVLEVACGTRYWTKVVAGRADHVLATDIDSAMVRAGRERCIGLENVEFKVADAYTLDGIPGGFNAAFANGWLSHVPRSGLGPFLSNLHSRLENGAIVLFIDQLFDLCDDRMQINESFIKCIRRA